MKRAGGTLEFVPADVVVRKVRVNELTKEVEMGGQ